MTRLRLGVLVLFATALSAWGCSLLPSPPAAAAALTPCAQVFNAVRCQAMTDTAASNLGLTREDVISLDIVPKPTPPQGVLTTTSGGSRIDVIVTLADGSTRATLMGCAGISIGWNPACQDDPHVNVGSIVTGGYRDVPEGSTPLPTIEPEAVGDTVALDIDRLDIPIDHVGRYEVPIGRARLPNGILTTASFDLVEQWPAHVTIIGERGVFLMIRSLEPDGQPFRNYYEHGWRPGTERVEAVLVFDVFRFDPGATLSIKDVEVR